MAPHRSSRSALTAASHRFVLLGGTAFLSVFLAGVPAAGADGSDEQRKVRGSERNAGTQQPPMPRRDPDFLFGPPRGSIGIRGSWLFASAASDLYDFVIDQLTLERRDFNAPVIGVEGGVATRYVDVLFGFDASRASTPSEYRNLVDQDDVPITQETVLTQMAISASVKVPLVARGRQVSRLAWIPRTVVPFVGGGGGYVWYRLKQQGDFVDFVDFSVFSDVLESSGWAPSAHALGGVDVRLARRLFLQLEGRYLWAAGELDRQFAGFDPLDLSGLKITVGLYVVF